MSLNKHFYKLLDKIDRKINSRSETKQLANEPVWANAENSILARNEDCSVNVLSTAVNLIDLKTISTVFFYYADKLT
jgi:hypothetical protein